MPKLNRGAAVLRRSGLAGIAVTVFCGAGLLIAQGLGQAEDRYQHADYLASLALLNKGTQDAPTNFLIGRNYFMLGDWKQATAFLQKASEQQPANSEYMDWLGRVYGKRAATGNVLMAAGFAAKARDCFERAVELNPKNSDAVSDLFDYYLNAPGFMGGGYEKAVAISNRMAVIDPPEGYSEKAKLAQRRKEYAAAEANLRRAVAARPGEVGHLLALAKFLAEQGRTQESDEAFCSAEKLAPNAPRVWYERAGVLIQQKRELNEARSLLQKYLGAAITPDDPPKQEAMRLLKQAGGA